MSNYSPAFPDDEYAERIERVRAKMAEEQLDVCVLSVPESICYLTGLNHWGFFGLHLLLVPREGDICLIARAMEHVTVEEQLASKVKFFGYQDDEKPATFAAQILKSKNLDKVRIGMDFDTLYRSYSSTIRLLEQLPEAQFVDSQELMDRLRFVKSPLEIATMRQAATISERMMEAAIKATVPGVNERTVAAEVLKEMTLAGGELPSFGPFIRPKKRLGEEHGTWGGDFLAANDTLFVELAGCYKRYHAPIGRFIYTNPPSRAERVQEICLEAFNVVTHAMKPGTTADEVYKNWQTVVDESGLSDYHRHHAGYMVGMSFPPTWMEGANRSPFGLRKGSDLMLESGMTFHVLSWLVGSRIGDYFVSNTVLVTDDGGESLTTTAQNYLAT